MKNKTYAEQKIHLAQLRKDVIGYYPLIAEACDKSIATVARVLKGDWVNEDIISSARKVQKFIKDHKG